MESGNAVCALMYLWYTYEAYDKNFYPSEKAQFRLKSKLSLKSDKQGRR